jgi:hypothetical protein
MAFPPEMQWDDKGRQAMRPSLATLNSTFEMLASRWH